MRSKTWYLLLPAFCLVAVMLAPRTPGGDSDINRRPPEKTKRVALVNAANSHDEVVVSLLWTLTQLPQLSVDLCFPKSRFGFSDLLLLFLPVFYPSKGFNDFLNNSSPVEDVFVLATCELDVPSVVQRFKNAEGMQKVRDRNITVVCVVHNPDDLHDLRSELSFLRERSKLVFLGLADHVVEYLRARAVPRLRLLQPEVELFVPIFPYLPFRQCSEMDADCTFRFAVQGRFESSRRSYNSFFSNLTSAISQDSSDGWKSFHLLILGSGSLAIPPALQPFTSVARSLSFLRFYEALHHNAAVLPLFAGNVYYEKKSSSSIAAALIAEVPLLVSRRTLLSYRYLTKEAVYCFEQEIDGIESILHFSTATHEVKRQSLRQLKHNLLAANVNLLARLLSL